MLGIISLIPRQHGIYNNNKRCLLESENVFLFFFQIQGKTVDRYDRIQESLLNITPAMQGV